MLLEGAKDVFWLKNKAPRTTLTYFVQIKRDKNNLNKIKVRIYVLSAYYDRLFLM